MIKMVTTFQYARSGVALCFSLILGMTSFSAISQTLAQAVEACSQERNSLQRLVCFDNIAKSVRQYDGGSEALRSVAMPPTNASRDMPAQAKNAPVARTNRQVPTPEQEFGLEHKRDTDEMMDTLGSTITKIIKDLRGKNVITLANGQIWKQVDGSPLKLAVGEAVFIERGVLGAFYLGKEGLNRRMKVKRAD